MRYQFFLIYIGYRVAFIKFNNQANQTFIKEEPRII
jgi:hypothetical protein